MSKKQLATTLPTNLEQLFPLVPFTSGVGLQSG